MANMITLQLRAPPATVDIKVDFYDKEAKEALLASPLAPLLANLPAVYQVTTTDLCAYYLYYKRRVGVPGHTTHDDMVRQWATALAEFDGQLEFGNGSLHLTSAANMSSGTTERLGEAIGLATASMLHGLHQADWTRIPITSSRKTLDFWHPWTASDGKKFVQVETKGSATEDNDYKVSSVSEHKNSIKAKKKEATPKERRNGILYGTIAVLGDRPDSVARCWLVDPPAEFPDDPRRFKVVSRLTYIADLIAFLSGRSSLSASLQTRLAALSALTDIADLNRVPLKKGNGDGYADTTFDRDGQHNPWFWGKSVVSDGPAGGQVYVFDSRRLIFIGLREQLVVYATQQDFSVLEQYGFPAGTAEKKVDCVVPAGRFKHEFERVIEFPEEFVSAGGGYVSFRLTGHLHYTQSGLVIGILPVPEGWQRR